MCQEMFAKINEHTARLMQDTRAKEWFTMGNKSRANDKQIDLPTNAADPTSPSAKPAGDPQNPCLRTVIRHYGSYITFATLDAMHGSSGWREGLPARYAHLRPIDGDIAWICLRLCITLISFKRDGVALYAPMRSTGIGRL